jgi:hypothetical protein
MWQVATKPPNITLNCGNKQQQKAKHSDTSELKQNLGCWWQRTALDSRYRFAFLVTMSETASFVDPVFLARFGLFRSTALDYFLHPLNPCRFLKGGVSLDTD